MMRRGGRESMYFRMLYRAAVLRKAQASAALAAIVIATAAAAAMLNLYLDVQAKLRNEFRKFGAGIVVEARAGESIGPSDLAAIRSTIGKDGVAVPFSYVVARTQNDQPVVVAGTNLQLARQLNPWWQVSSWPTKPHEALVGVRAARVLGMNNGAFTVKFEGRPVQLVAAGTVSTGAGEDSRVYLPQDDFQTWTGVNPSVVEIGLSGTPGEMNSVLERLKQTLPKDDVRAVRQVTEGEANIMGKMRSTLLSSSAFIAATAALCILATLMGWIYDRRQDFAIMKALGASDRVIAMFVAGEAIALASVGATLGFAGGVGIAMWIGRANFHAPVAPQWSVFPAVVVGCVVVTLISTFIPLRLLRKIQPAMILRGE